MSKPPRHNQRWTEEEDRTLYTHYQKKGPAWCARKLGRSRHAVRHRFSRNITPLEDRLLPPSRRLITTVEAAFLMNTSPRCALTAARRWGKVVEADVKPFIPEWWARQYGQDLRRWHEARQMNWYTRHNVERIFGFSRNASPLGNLARKRQGITFAIDERVRTIRSLPAGRKRDTGAIVHALRYNPWDVDALARDYHDGAPVLTDRQAALLVLMRHGHRLRRRIEGWTFYSIDLGDRSFGPLPQSMVSWLRDHGMITQSKRRDPEANGKILTFYRLTPEGEEKAVQIEESGRVDDAINRWEEALLDSAA